MHLTYNNLRNIKHLAVDFHIEHDADAFYELQIDAKSGLPALVAIDVADTGESRLYFTYSDPFSGDCTQFHINNVIDAMDTVTAVGEVYQALNYNPFELVRSFNDVGSEQLEQLTLLYSHFSIGIVSTYTKSFEVSKQLGAAYQSGNSNADYEDVYFTYKLGELNLDFSVQEVSGDEVIETLQEVASTYSKLVDTPLEILEHF